MSGGLSPRVCRGDPEPGHSQPLAGGDGSLRGDPRSAVRSRAGTRGAARRLPRDPQLTPCWPRPWDSQLLLKRIPGVRAGGDGAGMSWWTWQQRGRGGDSGRRAGRLRGLRSPICAKHGLSSDGVFVLLFKQPLQGLKSITWESADCCCELDRLLRDLPCAVLWTPAPAGVRAQPGPRAAALRGRAVLGTGVRVRCCWFTLFTLPECVCLMDWFS